MKAVLYTRVSRGECANESWPRCPHCGKVESDAWEWGLSDGEVEVFSCGRCDGEFEVEMHVSISYTTSPIDGWPEVDP